ncbi:hypothetical protein N7510_005184 [Penicillium lagena]|uniref:uncharacterized protein n=1 Tax=Penicillium lagena TaxID=94218 RepID=UPI00253F8768|nr:uncharacterized protein N7510_005184 [Penicillium lagena]KAJ5611990.1 hypothetical protein N7510_005184 [Penicillium lagena]
MDAEDNEFAKRLKELEEKVLHSWVAKLETKENEERQPEDIPVFQELIDILETAAKEELWTMEQIENIRDLIEEKFGNLTE